MSFQTKWNMNALNNKSVSWSLSLTHPSLMPTSPTPNLQISINLLHSSDSLVSTSSLRSTMSPSRVKVHSKLTVVSDTPVQPGKSYPLSVLDHAMSFHTVHIVFYYQHGQSYNGAFSDLGRLRESLAEVLTHYPPVTGRLYRGEAGNWEVKCNDAGVRVLKAKVDCSLDEWLRSAGGQEERDLTVWEEMPDDPKVWSPFCIQLNDFEGGGLAIGVSFTHMHADPTCATLFVKTWTELFRRVSIGHPPFFHPLGLHGRSSPKIDSKSAKYLELKSKSGPPIPVKMSTSTFRFSDTMIKKCLSEIHTKYPNATPFHVLSALFWSSITSAKTTDDQVWSLSICIDFRKLMHIPLPHGYFGNAIHFTQVSSDVTDMEEGGLDYTIGLVHDHLSTLAEEEYLSSIDWFESQKTGGKCAPPFRMYGPELTCVNLEHVQAYSAAFQDTKPVHVAYHMGKVEGEGLILVLPSPEEGLGRTIILTLPEDQMLKVCKDPAILGLEPSMLLSGERS